MNKNNKTSNFIIVCIIFFVILTNAPLIFLIFLIGFFVTEYQIIDIFRKFGFDKYIGNKKLEEINNFFNKIKIKNKIKFVNDSYKIDNFFNKKNRKIDNKIRNSNNFDKLNKNKNLREIYGYFKKRFEYTKKLDEKKLENNKISIKSKYEKPISRIKFSSSKNSNISKSKNKFSNYSYNGGKSIWDDYKSVIKDK